MLPHDRLLRRLRRGLHSAAAARVTAAAAYAQQHLSSVCRRSGEDYAQHGLEIAVTLREAVDDPSLLSVAVLHDVLVHPDGAALLRMAPLSEDERRLVRRMHRVRRLHIDARTRDLDTVIDQFVHEPRLTLLRMAHRCTDVEHLDRFGATLRRDIAKETLHMYTSIAGRLSMHAWRHRMEERCFRTLHPAAARTLERQMREMDTSDTACLRHAKRHITQALTKAHIPADIEGRRKGAYSSYRKMLLKERAFTELTDRLALRIVVGSLEECYRVLGVVHATMRPMPGKLKDYIGAPKENGYRSIHTVVFPLPGVSEFPIEVQIRTADMHRECEFGVPAHGTYKAKHYTLVGQHTRANLFRNLAALRMDAGTPRAFAASLRTYFNTSKLLVFNEHGTAWYLQKPASVVDFACHTAPRRAACLQEARVNGRNRPLSTLLSDGDTLTLRFGKRRGNVRALAAACRHDHARALLLRPPRHATPTP